MDLSLAESELTQRDTILDVAARCFMEQGFKAASIDEIARHLGATKGMVYHYFDSKTELFFQIHQRGMDALFEAVEPERLRDAPAVDRLFGMARRHVATLIETQHYHRAVSEAVQMHLRVSTTASQRERLARLQARRFRYGEMFLEVIEDGVREGGIRVTRPRIAIKPMLGALNSVVNWYHPRYGTTAEARGEIVEEVTRVALRGLVAGE